MGDLLYHITEWLRTTSLVDFALDMSDWPLSIWVVNQFWAIPILQMIHILSIAASFAAVLMLTLRVFGQVGHATLPEAGRRYSKILWWALVCVVSSGVAMLFGDTVRNLINAVFWLKMILVVIAILSAIAFSRNLRHNYSSDTIERVGAGTKIAALGLVVLWCAIMFAGRWIAYAPV